MTKSLLPLLIFTFFSFNLLAQAPFITTWETTTDNETVTIPTAYYYSYNYTINWGDGNIDSGLTSDASHVYANAGVHTISITGDFPALGSSDDKERQILTIEQWGDIEWRTMFNAFSGCEKLTYNAVDAPDLSNTVSLSQMFSRASSFDGDLSNWDVSNIRSTRYIFSLAKSFNGDISNWDVSSVTNMYGMFFGAESFNQDISNWDVSSVTNMGQLFAGTDAFDQDISGWDVSSVTNMSDMFSSSESFNFDITSWDVSSVVDMDRMFYANTAVNVDLNNWDVGAVTDMSQMFYLAENFNGNISTWDVSNVTDMREMFSYAKGFNGDIGSWDVSSVTDMSRMFNNAEIFNQNIDDWNVGAVTTMSEMFRYAQKFNQSLNSWNVSNVVDMSQMFDDAYEFNQDLNSWDVSAVTDMSSMFASARKFNGNIGAWDVSSVTNMYLMFYFASDFNSDISAWDVSSVTDLRYMLSYSSFNQDISDWDISNITDLTQFLHSTDMSVANYDALLQSWSALPNLKQNVSFGVSGLKFCSGKTARSNLINNNEWNFSGDEENCGNLAPTDIKLSNTSFSENNNVGDVVATLTAIDQNETDTHTFELYGVYDNASFSISGNELIAEEIYDASTKNEYSIRLKVTDQDGASYISFSLKIEILQNQVINFDPIADKVYNDSFELTASSDSGLPVTYQSSDETVATIAGSTVTIVGTGIADITASQSGNSVYDAASDVIQQLTVNKADQSILFEALADNTFGEDAYELTATADSGLPVSYTSSDETVAVISGSTVTLLGAGTTNITASQIGNDNYLASNEVIQELTVDKASQSISFNSLSDKSYGDAEFELTAVADSELSVSYTSSDETVATISGNMVSILSAGTTNITANQSGNDNYHAANEVIQELTINKASQSLSFDALSNKTYGDASFELSSTGGNSGNEIVYTSSNETVAEVSGNTVTILGAGTTDITASQAGNENYLLADDVIQELTVNKASQDISFDALSNKTYGDAEFELSATGGESGEEILFSSTDETVASISGSTVSIVGAGTANIIASQAGNENYNSADNVIQELIVTKASQSISFNPLSDKTFGDSEFELTATSDSGLAVVYESSDETVAIVSGSTVTILGAGTTNITASQLGNENYLAADEVVQELTVDKAAQSISFNALSDKIYGDDSFELSATSDSGLAVVYESSDETVATVSGSTVTLVGAGTTNITASQLGNENYLAANEVVQELTVDKATQSISFNALSDKIYGDDSFELSATSGSGLAIVYASSDETVATVSGSTVTILGAGTTNITASQLGNDNYFAAEEVIQELTINKSAQSILFNTLSDKIFGDAEFELTAVADSELSVSYTSSDRTVATISGNMVSILSAGTTNITATQSGNDNYLAANEVIQELTVNKAPQSISFDALSNKTYGDAEFELSAIGGESGEEILFSSTDETVASISGSTVSIVGAGTANIIASQAGNENYNSADNVIQELIVDKASQSISFNPLSDKTFGDSEFDLTATSDSGLAVVYESSDETVAAISGSTVTLLGAGTTNITARQLGNENYLASDEVVQELTVNKASQSISFNSLSDKSYGGAEFELTAVADSELSVSYTSSDETVATVSGNMVSILSAGTANITANQSGNDNYHAANEVIQELTVNKASQSISFDALSNKTYGDASFELSSTGGASGNEITYTSSNETVATISGNTVTILAAGNTNITASQAGNENYLAADHVVQEFTVNKASQSMSFDALSDKTYGDASFNLTATSDSGLPITYTSSDETIASISGSTVSIVGTGTVEITASQTGNDNYLAADEVVQELTVLKAAQNISFDALQDKTYGDAVFELTATSDAGLPITYESSDETIASISGSTVSIVGTGTIEITASQTGNDNYQPADDVVQEFTANKADQSISFDALSDKIYGDTTFELTATTDSELPVTFESSDETVASIADNVVTILTAGTTTITVSQSGNENYNPAADVSQELIINKANQEITVEEIGDKEVDAQDFEVVASTDSGLELTYSVLSGPANLNGNVVGLTGEAGTVEIEVSQSGNLNFNPESVIISFDVIDLCAGFDASVTVIQNVSCFEGANGSFEVTLNNGTAPFIYSIGSESQEDNGLFDGQSAGSYEIRVTDANGCAATAFVEITQPDPIEVTAEITESNTTNGNGSITLTVAGGTGNYSYEWNNGATEANLSGLTIGEYSVTVSDDANCSITETFSVGGVTSNDSEIQSAITIYPNPTNGQVNVIHPSTVKLIKLYDAYGRLIDEQLPQTEQTVFDVKTLSSGLYFIQLDNGNLNRIVKK